MARGKVRDTKYLRQDKNRWYIRKRLSPILAEKYGKAMVEKSTGTGDLDEACMIRDRFLVELADEEALLKRRRKEAAGEIPSLEGRRLFLQLKEQYLEEEERLARQSDGQLSLASVLDVENLSDIEQDALRSLVKGGTPKDYSLSLCGAMDDWLVSPLLDLKVTTKTKNKHSVKLFLKSLGRDDIALSGIDRKKVKAFIVEQLSKGKTPQTVSNYLGGLSAMWTHAKRRMEEEGLPENPFLHHDLKPKAGIQSYGKFSREEVLAIFEHTKGEAGIKFLLPRLGFYTGARIEELCSLKVSDVLEVDGVWCLAIREGKNKNAIRDIPIHSELLPLVQEQVQKAKMAGTDYLFPEVTESVRADGKTAPKWTQWFLRERRKVMGDGGRKMGFHSFRVTAITIMLGRGVSESDLVWISGHEKGFSTASKVYNRGPLLKQRLAAIETISLDGEW